MQIGPARIAINFKTPDVLDAPLQEAAESICDLIQQGFTTPNQTVGLPIRFIRRSADFDLDDDHDRQRFIEEIVEDLRDYLRRWIAFGEVVRISFPIDAGDNPVVERADR